MNLNELRDCAHKCARDHGFHEKGYPIEHWLMLVITELSEMVNADRKNAHADVDTYKQIAADCNETFSAGLFERYIKDSVEDEMADVVVRLFDFAGLKNIDLSGITQEEIDDIYGNIGIKPTDPITLIAYIVTSVLSNPLNNYVDRVPAVVAFMYAAAQMKGVDLEWHIEQKMQYNELRPKLNGKQY